MTNAYRYGRPLGTVALTDPIDPHDPLQRQTHVAHWAMLLGKGVPTAPLVQRTMHEGKTLAPPGLSAEVGRVHVLRLCEQLTVVTASPLGDPAAQPTAAFLALGEGGSITAEVLQLRPWTNGFDARVDIAIDGRRQLSHQRTIFATDAWLRPTSYDPGLGRSLQVGGLIDQAKTLDPAPSRADAAVVPLWQLLNSSNPADEVQFLAPIEEARSVTIPLSAEEGNPAVPFWVVSLHLGPLGVVPMLLRSDRLASPPRKGSGLFGTAWLQCWAGPLG